MNTHSFHPLTKAATLCCALGLAIGLAGCGGSTNPTPSEQESSPSSASSGAKLEGVSADGKPGQKPKISFKTPLTVTDKASAVLQEGDGDALQDGDHLCVRSVAVNAKDGKELDSTWEKGAPDCQIVVDHKTYGQYYDAFKSMKVNGTLGVGINDASGKAAGDNAYVMALTVVSKFKPLARATGEKARNIPADLPKVTLASNGKPSLDLNNYKPTDKLVAQPLITGNGPKVKADQSITAHYTGWLASDGKQFDSSWDKGEPADFSLDGVVKGWKQGLAGQTVGSQVLLVVPPSLGYGSSAQKGIPANSTLIFVVDILAAH
ncbi:FKBP-type peptidyl-prolyl cis-trans isomerase [Bifidobacterium xylocopae]|uniref:Peptidyl-prolyl cis-trans isomerase n=1 Tax=Bifidobacterium xylocopae TaxID=2493119 RepID=A0A366KCA9_9BIFI|nr:FKBP-type peptidyl-prolyl cis-trans isomerase [Bifidobacterium xylocopae]RBP98872.1 peptidylprolyl isomerase [Bifidobacterium xylocopae]